MDARAYLRAQRSRIRAMEIRIEMQMERESRLRSRLSRSTALADGMPRGGGGEDAMARGMAELEALEREIDQSLGALADMKRRLEDCLLYTSCALPRSLNPSKPPITLLNGHCGGSPPPAWSHPR